MASSVKVALAKVTPGVLQLRAAAASAPTDGILGGVWWVAAPRWMALRVAAASAPANG
jgi:hypothetical protein